MKAYRQDIDGIRALAVVSVIIFHLGFLPNGYLGVDVFFVISGYLITSIIYREISENKFSLKEFYVRRIRRILPLLFFITLIALAWGIMFMLPDDLENMSQSVIASNFSVNNILMLITSSDYWAVQNEYKPLMHTWSLGIEEQFYLIYPFIILVVAKFNKSYIKHVLIAVTAISLLLFLWSQKENTKFFLLHFRFFELSIGGWFAIYFFNKKTEGKMIQSIWIVSLLALMVILFIPYQNNKLNVILVTLLTVVVLTLGQNNYTTSALSKSILQNKLVVYLGKISFSLYLWHQVVFAYARYSFFEEIHLQESLLLTGITLVLSALTYQFIENPFRNKKIMSTKRVITILGVLVFVSSSTAFYLYSIGGVYKDFPSVGLYKVDVAKMGFNFFSSTDNIHIHYNERIRKMEVQFESNDKIKVLVAGNSFGRDVVNIFLESGISDKIEVRYANIETKRKDDLYQQLSDNADLIVFCARDYFSKNDITRIEEKHNIQVNRNKVFCFGTKDFGHSNGIHYYRLKNIDDFTKYHAKMNKGVLENELGMREEWGENYISLLQPVLNEKNEVRVFSDEGLFISPDTQHLTKPGAQFFAKILDEKLIQLTSNIQSK